MARKRNRALRPRPVRDAHGRPLPTRTVRLDDGERVEVVDAGDGPPLLWIPGADGIKETWAGQLPVFARRYRVIAPNLRKRITSLDTLDRLARDMERVLGAAGAGPAVVVGQSLGGAVAMQLAFRFPERVTGLVLCNSLTRVSYEHLGLNRTALVPLAMATTRYLPTPLARLAGRLWCRAGVWIFDDGAGRDDLVHYALFTGPRATPPRISSARVRLLRKAALRRALASISVPTLVVKGPLDTYCPPRWSLDIAAQVRGAAYATVPETGHCSHISRPEAFNRIVGEWVDRHTPSTRTGRDG